MKTTKYNESKFPIITQHTFKAYDTSHLTNKNENAHILLKI